MLASSVCALISSLASAAAAAGMLSCRLHCSAMNSKRSIFARPTNPLAYSCDHRVSASALFVVRSGERELRMFLWADRVRSDVHDPPLCDIDIHKDHVRSGPGSRPCETRARKNRP